MASLIALAPSLPLATAVTEDCATAAGLATDVLARAGRAIRGRLNQCDKLIGCRARDGEAPSPFRWDRVLLPAGSPGWLIRNSVANIVTSPLAVGPVANPLGSSIAAGGLAWLVDTEFDFAATSPFAVGFTA